MPLLFGCTIQFNGRAFEKDINDSGSFSCAWSNEYRVCFCGGDINSKRGLLTWVPDKVCGK